MNNKNGENKERMGPVNFILTLFGALILLLFAASSLFFIKQGHMPSYYMFDKRTVSEFSIDGTVMHFKVKDNQADFKIEFNEPPNIKKTDKIDVYYNYKQGVFFININEKIAYNTTSDLKLTETILDKKTGLFISRGLQNIKETKDIKETNSIL